MNVVAFFSKATAVHVARAYLPMIPPRWKPEPVMVSKVPPCGCGKEV